MIVGNGMISKSFKSSNICNKNLCVFASGVPNSLEIDEKEYEKEFLLLKQVYNNNQEKKFIYFSTSSIETGKKSRYISHKIKIENYIESNFNDFLIVRLPNIIGFSSNRSQLVPYLYQNLIQNKKLYIKKKCFRFLIDVEDLPSIIECLIKSKTTKKIITINFNNKIEVSEIVEILSKINSIYNKELVEVSSDFEKLPNNKFFISLIEKYNYGFNIDPFEILNKYYNNLS